MIPASLNGQVTDAPLAQDRGLHYGDGVFETVLFIAGQAPLWPWHVRRLHAGCARLGIEAPDPEVLWREARVLLRDQARAVIKIICTRGAARRGYAPTEGSPPTRLLLRYPYTDLPEDWKRHGVDLRWCDTRWPLDPTLAGIKHLNRLHQVLARAEWRDPAIYDGLCLDTDGHVIGATSANVFVWTGSALVTPDVSRCGLSGVCRAALLERLQGRYAIRIQPLYQEQLVSAQAIFLTNAVRGVLPVRRLAQHTYAAPPQVVSDARQALLELGFAG